MKEIFKASHPDHTANWRSAPHPALLPVWWALWIISGVAGQAVFRLSLRAETAEELLAASRATLFSDMIDVPLGIVAIMVVAKLQGWQSDKDRRLASAAAHEWAMGGQAPPLPVQDWPTGGQVPPLPTQDWPAGGQAPPLPTQDWPAGGQAPPPSQS
jgi:hypothetical protein